MTDTQMRREILEIPAAVDRLLTDGRQEIEIAAQALRALDPGVIITVARGSSDHAATYFKYASELVTGVPVASVGPSVASVYRRKLKVKGGGCLAISQSGQSPDIVELARMASQEGATAIALTNMGGSPLAGVCNHCVGLHAGPETSVAATKTFVTSVVASVALLAHWMEDADLIAALYALPGALDKATNSDWDEVCEAIGERTSLYCLGRGPAYAIANEAALKFKETSQLHAESYSSAEVLHGPVSIVGTGFPVLALAADDAALPGILDVADGLADKGASVFVTSDKAKKATCIPHVRTGHPLTDPIALITSFYAMVEQVATRRGHDPDAPRHLNKVTETV